MAGAELLQPIRRHEIRGGSATPTLDAPMLQDSVTVAPRPWRIALRRTLGGNANTTIVAGHFPSSAVDTPTESWRLIIGVLANGYRLTAPLRVQVWQEDGEYVAAAPDVDIHAFGGSAEEASAHLCDRIVAQRTRLLGMRGRLGPAMSQLADTLESLIVPVDA